MSGSLPIHFVEVTTRALEGLPDARGDSVRSMLAADHDILVGDVRVSLGYQIQAEMTSEQIERTVYDLFADPVIEHGSCNGALLGASEIFPSTPEAAIQVGFKPGVTDNAGQRPGWATDSVPKTQKRRTGRHLADLPVLGPAGGNRTFTSGECPSQPDDRALCVR